MNNNENKTLDCDIVCDLLELYHDDIVRPTTKKAVDSHLENCESCKKEYEKITAISPSPQELSTRKEFAKLMKKKKTKQIVTTVICCLLACLILASSYWALTQAHLRVRDVEVHQVYKYTAPDNHDYFFVLYTYEGGSSSSVRSEVKREFFEDGAEEERVTLVYDTMIPLITNSDYDGTYTEIDFFRADKISTTKNGVINFIDIDELVMSGNVVWTKEADETDDIPGYLRAYYDFEFSDNYNNDEFGDSDSMTMGFSIDSDNLVSDESYIYANYPDKTIKWNLKGEVIEEKLKETSSAESE